MTRIIEVLDNLGIKYSIDGNNALVEFWTDTAGQDIPTEFTFDGTAKDFVKQFTEAAENYDVDAEVELYADMRGKNGVPATIRELLDDCEEAKQTLMDIAQDLQRALEYIDPYAYSVDVDGQEVNFGFNGENVIVLFGGGYYVTYPESMTLDEVKQDLVDNYLQYKSDDLDAHYRAWGYYD